MTNARHLSLSVSHYTPTSLVEAARSLLGVITLDPASCATANETVRATTFFTREDDGLSKPWSGSVFLNPPGGRLAGNRSSQKVWWFKLVDEYLAGRVTRAIFVAFSIELLQTTQNDTAPGALIPLDFPMCIPSSRIEYVLRTEEAPQRGLFGDEPDKREVTGESPPHASALIYLPPRENCPTKAVRDLEERFGAFGACRLLGGAWHR